MKTTMKTIKQMCAQGIARDVTHEYAGDPSEFYAKYHGETVMSAYGVYGLNAKVVKTYKTGELVAVTSRSTALYAL